MLSAEEIKESHFVMIIKKPLLNPTFILWHKLFTLKRMIATFKRIGPSLWALIFLQMACPKEREVCPFWHQHPGLYGILHKTTGTYTSCLSASKVWGRNFWNLVLSFLSLWSLYWSMFVHKSGSCIISVKRNSLCIYEMKIWNTMWNMESSYPQFHENQALLNCR